MNVQLNPILARHRTAELQRAGEQARLAREVCMRGRKLRHRNLITRLRARPARELGTLILPAMLAVLALSAPAAMADPVGQVSEFSTAWTRGASRDGSRPGRMATCGSPTFNGGRTRSGGSHRRGRSPSSPAA